MKIGMKINFFEKIDHTVLDSPRSVDAVAYLITEELVKRNHDVTVFTTSDSETAAHIAPNAYNSQEQDIQKCNAYSAGLIHSGEEREQYKNLLKELRHKAHLNMIEMAKDFDIIHTHDLYVENSFAQYAKDVRIPVVTTLHGARMEYENLASNHSFVAISQKQKELYPDLPIVGIAYNGIKVEDFTLSNNVDDYMFFLGRITPDKGPLEAIEVAKRTNKQLRIAGVLDYAFPEHVQKFQDAVAANANVQYLGEVSKEERNTLLRNASVVLMPIQWEEPFGLVAVEALASGTPVIAMRRGALPEIIVDGKTGFIVDTVDQMCDSLDKISSIDRKACRKHVEEHFTVSKMVDSYEQLYTKILGNVSKSLY